MKQKSNMAGGLWLGGVLGLAGLGTLSTFGQEVTTPEQPGKPVAEQPAEPKPVTPEATPPGPATPGVPAAATPAKTDDAEHPTPTLQSTGGQVSPAATATAPKRHSVAIFGYTSSHQPVASFNGVWMGGKYLLTSSPAIRQANLRFADKGTSEPATNYVALLGPGPHRLKVRCIKAPVKGLPEIGVLQVVDEDLPLLTKLGTVPTVGIESSANLVKGSVSGSVSPFGLMPEQVGASTVTPPMTMSVTTRKQGLFDVQLLSIQESLPSSMVGAGVWSPEDKLSGILTRQDGVWRIADLTGLAPELSGSAPVKPGPAPAIAPNTPMATTPNPAKPPMVAVNPGMAEIFKTLNLTPVLDPVLFDLEDNADADMVMAYVAAAKPDEALAKIKELDATSRGDDAERLAWRKALAHVLLGQIPEAAESAKFARNARLPMVRSRGQVLAKLLEDHADGNYEGKPLKEPATLAAAWKAEMEKIAKPLAGALKSIQSQRLVSGESFDLIQEKIKTLRNQVSTASNYSFAYFADLRGEIETFSMELTRREYARCRLELETLRKDYAEAMKKVEKRGVSRTIVKAGYWPKIRVGAVNSLAERYNNSLEHFGGVEQMLPQTERSGLTAEMKTPLQKLQLAVEKEIPG